MSPHHCRALLDVSWFSFREDITVTCGDGDWRDELEISTILSFFTLKKCTLTGLTRFWRISLQVTALLPWWPCTETARGARFSATAILPVGLALAPGVEASLRSRALSVARLSFITRRSGSPVPLSFLAASTRGASKVGKRLHIAVTSFLRLVISKVTISRPSEIQAAPSFQFNLRNLNETVHRNNYLPSYFLL